MTKNLIVTHHKIKSSDLKDKDVLFLDLETSFNEGNFWRPGKQVIGHHNIHKERQIICASYKWGGEKTVTTIHFGLKKQDDTDLLLHITKIINSAQVVIGQNSDRFDLPWIQGRLFMKQLPPIVVKPLLVTLDTLKLARNSLGLNSYRLDYLSKIRGYGGKIRMEFGDWLDIHYKKCPIAFAKMLRYCPKDVVDTEHIFLDMRAYVKLPLKLSAILTPKEKLSINSCSNCASNHVTFRGSYTLTGGSKKRRLQCQDCGKWSAGEKV